MSKISIIILREFTTRVTKKSFILMTILSPFLMAALVFIPIWLGQMDGNDQEKIVVIDPTNHYFECLENSDRYVFERAYAFDPAFRTDTTDVTAVLQITDDLALNPKGAILSSRNGVQLGTLEYIEACLLEQVRHDKLEHYGIPNLEEIKSDLDAGLSITTVKWDKEGGETFSSSDIAMAAGFLFTFLIYMFVMSYGGMVMSGVTEEKTNRIVEIMVSSVKPFQLMMGKIIGVALVGIVQMTIWGIMLAAIIFGAGAVLNATTPDPTKIVDAPATVAAAADIDQAALQAIAEEGTTDILAALQGLPYLEIGIMFLLMFIGGYLLYASFFAAIGASVNNQEDSSQFMLPVILIMVFGMYAAMGSAGNTDGPLAFWSSLFPLTAPIVMMVRIPFGVPHWQEILSVSLLYGCALGMVWVAGRIYRIGILMYGGKPSFRDLWKWIRY